MEDEEHAEEERNSTKEEIEIQNSPDHPLTTVATPINLPSLQNLVLPVTSFICEMPDCGAVSMFIKTGGICSSAVQNVLCMEKVPKYISVPD